MKSLQTITIGGRESRRLTAPIELRAIGDSEQSNIVFGYAAKFNSRSGNLGEANRQFYETIAPGAFDDVLLDDVRALFNHEADMILARSKNGEGTLTLGIDDVGLTYMFEAPDTQVGRDLLVSLRRGDIDQSSFSFTVSKDGQSWVESRDENGATVFERTINKVSRLYDVSPVTYPAYEDTEVDVRSITTLIKDFQPEETPPPAPLENHSLSHWQRRWGISKPAV